jgi:tRNA pseudouridine38-40 synthase
MLGRSVNIKLTIEYDGSRYCGWQVQAKEETIQAVVERALSTLLGKSTRVIASGRTDAGVHALGQVANFHCEGHPDLFRVQRGLNALTPEDITVKEVEVVADAFDARRDGRARLYEYRILNRSTPSPFHLRRAWHVHEPLDVDAMRAAIGSLVGEHDFSSFRAAGCDAAHPVRTVYRTSLDRSGDLLIFTIEATAFLRHMVRNVVGTLVEVGRRERSVKDFADLLVARDRTLAGRTAPPHGLYLVKVEY